MGIDPDRKPSKKQPKKVVSNDKREKVPFGASRFARIELSTEEKEDFKALLANGEFGMGAVSHWLDMGYKLSLNRDEAGGGIVAVLSPIFKDCENAGLQLSGRAGDFATALAVLEYKDFYVAGEDGWAACENRRGGSYQDIG